MAEVQVPPLGEMPINGVTMTQWGVDPQNVGKRIPINQVGLPGITRTELAELVINAVQAVQAGVGSNTRPARAWAETYWRDRQAEWFEHVGLKPAAKPVKSESKIKIAEA